MSIDEHFFRTLRDEIDKVTKTSLDDLKTIWNALRLDQETVSAYGEMALGHIKKRWNDMVSEADNYKNCLVKNVEKLLSKVSDMQKQLHVKIDMEKYDNNMPLDKLEKILEEDMRKLQIQLKERKQTIKKLQEKELKICEKIDITSKSLSLSPIATLDEISEFEEHIKILSERQLKLEETFLDRKTVIVEIMKKLALQPETDFERSVMFNADKSFSLSYVNMNRLEKLQSDLKTRLEERKVCVDKIRQEVLEWWSKCRYGREQRNTFIAFKKECYTEDHLTLHEMEVQKLKLFYETNEKIFSTLNKRDDLWQEIIEFKNSANDPNRYKNRGAYLLQEEKQRKALANKLPRIEKTLREMIGEYESSNGVPFLIDGETIQNIIENSWKNFKQQNHSELSVRKQARDRNVTPHKTPTMTRSRLTPSMRRSRVMPATVGAVGFKRKLVTPVTQSSSAAKKSRILSEGNNREPLTTGAVKKTVNILKKTTKVSGVRKRLDMSFRPKRSISPSKRKKAMAMQASPASTTTDHDLFEQNIENRQGNGLKSPAVDLTPGTITASRSTPVNKEKMKQNLQVPSCSSSRTPRTQRTPKRSPHRTPVDLPILF